MWEDLASCCKRLLRAAGQTAEVSMRTSLTASLKWVAGHPAALLFGVPKLEPRALQASRTMSIMSTPGLFRVTGAALMLTAALLAVPPTHARVDVDSELHGYYDGCIAKFTAAKKRDLVDQLDRSKHVFKIVPYSATDSNPTDVDLARKRGVGSGGTTKINPNDTSLIDGESPPIRHDPCATLYHEMAHLVGYDNGTLDRRFCEGSKSIVTLEEVQATWAENRYRATQPDLKGFLRNSYGGGFPLPPDGQMCKPAPDPPPRRSGGCNVSAVGAPTCGVSDGDPHLTTFDQLHYDFQAVGEFVAVRSTRRADLEIQVRQAAMENSNDVSANTAVAMLVNGDVVGLYMTRGEPKLQINGKAYPLSQLPVSLRGNGVIRRLETDELSVMWPDGSEALLYQIGRYGFRLGVNLAEGRRGGVEGLLGNFDGDAGNDLRIRGGSVTLPAATFEALYPRFSDSWRISGQTSMFQYGDGQSTQTFTNRRLPTRSIDANTLPNRAKAEAACSGLKDDRLREGCMLDVGVSGDAAFAKSARNTETVFLAKVRTGAVSTGGSRDGTRGLVLSGRVTGHISPAVADCTTISNAGQFAMSLSGSVNGNKVELFVNVTQAFRGAGTYAIGSIVSNGGQASLGYGADSFATDSGQPGTLRVDADNRSGELTATLGGVDIKGRWTCGNVTRL